MEHDPTRRAERKAELQADAYDLEELAPAQVAWLIAALGEVRDAEYDRRSKWETGSTPADDVMAKIGRNMEKLPESAPDRAVELYRALIKHDEETRLMAVTHLGGSLMRQYAEDPEKCRAIADSWASLMDDEDDLVREVARDTLSEMNHAATWLDESTRQYIDDKLPGGWRREGA